MYWTRVQDPTGTTNMDFEFNKRQCTPGLNPADPDCAANGLTPLRSQGDLLITYDLTNGGTQATMSFRTWNGTATSGSWSGSTPFGTNSIGTINTSRIPLTGTSTTATDGLGDFLDPRTFGEAQIRLSSIFTDPNVCQSFGSVYLKSRSAAQFNSALKDFVPPKAVNISNCGSVHITKTDDATPGNPLEGAEFTAYTDAAPTTGQTEPGPEDDVVAGTCTTDDTGVCNIQSLLAGPYWIVETVTPTGFDTADPQHVVVTTNSEANLTFVDPAQKGAIQVTKTAKHADSNSPPNLAATFSVKQGDTVKGTIQTDGTTGIGCLGDLPQGSYTVEETDAADGYALDPDVKDVNVNSAGTCASGAVNVGFENTPLTDLSVSVDSQVDGGTASTIDCVDSADASVASGSTGANGDGSASATDLAPDKYTCTVVVDP
jgi:hypothetical protein